MATLFSRNFPQKCVTVNFHYFHTVHWQVLPTSLSVICILKTSTYVLLAKITFFLFVNIIHLKFEMGSLFAMIENQIPMYLLHALYYISDLTF